MKTGGNDIYISKLPKNAKFICLFSGGKDSAIALSIALENGKPIALIHCVDEDTGSSAFHNQYIQTIELQSLALNIPIIFINYLWWERWDKIIRLYGEFKKQGVEYVVFGDLRFEDNMIIQIKLCEASGLIPCFPLCDKSYEYIIDELENRRIKCVITNINHKSVEKNWLGKIFDRTAYNAFCKLDIDPFGENGEFHTVLVDSVDFIFPLVYDISLFNENNIRLEVKNE